MLFTVRFAVRFVRAGAMAAVVVGATLLPALKWGGGELAGCSGRGVAGAGVGGDSGRAGEMRSVVLARGDGYAAWVRNGMGAVGVGVVGDCLRWFSRFSQAREDLVK